MEDNPLQGLLRSRTRYFSFLILTIIAGVASRAFPSVLPSALGKYPGDALWTIAVYLIWCILLPGASPLKITGLALVISYADEIMQLYHAPWIDGIRSTYLGHIILGSSFAWADIVAYTAGGLLAFTTEWLILKTIHKTKTQ